MHRTAPPPATGSQPSNDDRERETSCSMILSEEEWQLLTTAAALAGPGVPLAEFARNLLLRAAHRALASDDELH